MSIGNKNSGVTPRPAWETKAVVWLCLMAGLHVYIFSAAFAFFNIVDEAAHFDLVVKYAHGGIPRGLDNYSPESVKYFMLYGSPYYASADTNVQEFVPQPWKYPLETQEQIIQGSLPDFARPNYEASQPPMYYALTGAWWRWSGEWKLNDHWRLYGLHFLNIPIVGLLVWLGWMVAKNVFPNEPFPRLTVPAMIAFMPQSAFYSIQNDVLSPLFMGVAFLGLLRFASMEAPGWRWGILTGLSLAAAFLTKMTNVPLIAIFLLAVAIVIRRHVHRGSLRPAGPGLAVLLVSAALPALVWMIWCHQNYGDFTGSKPRMIFWGWTPKPVTEWFHHPIFTPKGLEIFISGFIREFWQGEMMWHVRYLKLSEATWFYNVMTITILAVTLCHLIRHLRVGGTRETNILWFSLALFASVIAFLIYISIRFDFHNCFYPSRNFPYLISGRLALGALIPFMLVFACGLDRILKRGSLNTKFALLAVLICVMLGFEFATNLPVFHDQYNWYHM